MAVHRLPVQDVQDPSAIPARTRSTPGGSRLAMLCYAGPGGRLAAAYVSTEKNRKEHSQLQATCGSPGLPSARSSCSPTCSTSTLGDEGVTRERRRTREPRIEDQRQAWIIQCPLANPSIRAALRAAVYRLPYSLSKVRRRSTRLNCTPLVATPLASAYGQRSDISRRRTCETRTALVSHSAVLARRLRAVL